MKDVPFKYFKELPVIELEGVLREIAERYKDRVPPVKKVRLFIEEC